MHFRKAARTANPVQKTAYSGVKKVKREVGKLVKL